MEEPTLRITRDFLQILKAPPPECYYRFLRDNGISIDRKDKGIPNPFAFYLDPSFQPAYFRRWDLEERTALWTNQIIEGMRFTGLSALANETAEIVRSAADQGNPPAGRTLVVMIRLSDTKDLMDEQEFRQGRASPLDERHLGRIIFNSLFEQVIAQEGANERDLANFCQDREWMEWLRWLYQFYQPRCPTEKVYFALLNWLRSDFPKRPDWPATDREALDRLIVFITQPVPNWSGAQPGAMFNRILVLVDETEAIGEKAVQRLLDDFNRLVHFDIEPLRIKLFINRFQADALENLECLVTGRVQVIPMPRWEKFQIQSLLLVRSLLCTGRFNDLRLDMRVVEQSGIEDNKTTNWTWRLVPHLADHSIRAHLFRRLVETPLRVYEPAFLTMPNMKDAPYHVFQLTRGILTLYAQGRYQEITLDSIDKICDAYWKSIC